MTWSRRVTRTIQTPELPTPRVTSPTKGLSSLCAERLDGHSICACAKRVWIFFSFFPKKKNNF